MKHLINIIALLFILITTSLAQNPKWLKKALKAQITIVTYDKEGNILRSGQGFFIDEQGTAVADYTLFHQAYSARVITADGKELQVNSINGASSLYDVVKFNVCHKKKTNFLNINNRKAAKNEQVYILPYPTNEKRNSLNEKITDIQVFGEKYEYYTMEEKTTDMYINSPVMNIEGEVMGMIQRNAAKSTTSYAIDVKYIADMGINALSAGNNDLNNIHIKKALPTEYNEINTFLFMMQARTDSAEYHCYLNDLVSMYPDSSYSYTKRAEFLLNHGNCELAESDLQTALKLSEDQAGIYYTFSKNLYDMILSGKYTQYKDWDMNKALELIQKAYSIQPQPFYALQEAKTLYALKEYEKAHDKFLWLTQTNMRSADLFLYAAECMNMYSVDTLSILALRDSAVACYTKPYPADAANALIRRASTLIELNRHREAVVDLYEYERLINGELPATFYYRRFLSEQSCRMYQQALDDIDRAIRLTPNESLYHLQRAVLLYKVGELEEAIRSARKATEISPDDGEAYRILGICLIEDSQHEKGQECLKKAILLGDEAAKRLLQDI